MKIAMFTNTYLPQVGGVANSVERFTRGCRDRGHEVLVVAPHYENDKQAGTNVHRVPAVANLNGSDFSMALPVDSDLRERVKQFAPDLLHSHHPFLLGNTALRISAEQGLPLLFTHHTMYEHYTHYVPMELEAMKTYVKNLATGYGNLADRVIAPSESTASIIRQRGVESPIDVVPTGVDVEAYRNGDAQACRKRFSIDPEAPLIGHVGRLAEEKNISLLGRACGLAMQQDSKTHFLVVGDGDSREQLDKILVEMDVGDRAVFAGTLKGQDLVDAYHAMDVFAFASQTETQGMVLAEACGAGCPVVALDAPGAREVVADGDNGRLIASCDAPSLADGILCLLRADKNTRGQLARCARQRARAFSSDRCVEKLLDAYRHCLETAPKEKNIENDSWKAVIHRLQEEWKLWSNRMQSAFSALDSKSESSKQSDPEGPG